MPLERLFDDHKSVADTCAKMGLEAAHLPLQVARLRRAWQAVRNTADDAAKLKKKRDEDVDLDTPLPKPELDKLRELVWRRYKVVLPAPCCLVRRANLIRRAFGTYTSYDHMIM